VSRLSAVSLYIGAHMKDLLQVTRPILPSLEELTPYLERIWDTGVLTNGGVFHNDLETALAAYLGVEKISAFCNGTIALLTAVRALGITGEVITTPFTFAATPHALAWNGIRPIFTDIDPRTFNLDPRRIEEAITESTTAILAVHVYGVPCDIDAISDIASRHNLKVIYDAAHAFGVECHCGSLLNHGDASILSFHATKVFHTLEGGAVTCKSREDQQRVERLRNFGIINEVETSGIGLNGKLNEIQASIGLLNLKHIDEAIAKRKSIAEAYRHGLSDLGYLELACETSVIRDNYAYYPVLVREDAKPTRDEVADVLLANGIRARKYFYPLVNSFEPYSQYSSPEQTPVARSISDRILCLPIFPDMTDAEVHKTLDVLGNLN
jgi:dTDP-4-amino-4,6-dideoxygalactose transaminase